MQLLVSKPCSKYEFVYSVNEATVASLISASGLYLYSVISFSFDSLLQQYHRLLHSNWLATLDTQEQRRFLALDV